MIALCTSRLFAVELLTVAPVPSFPATLMKLEEMQMKDTLRMFNGLVERCFGECVNSFRSKALSGPEEKCINTCAEKFVKHTGRVGQRFGELTSQSGQAQSVS